MDGSKRTKRANAFFTGFGKHKRIALFDTLVAQQTTGELLGVLAHEIGHVARRHGMRSIVQDSLLGFAILAITGDITGSSELFIGLPVLLTELAYSREFEHEADEYALAYMQDNAIDLNHFANLMRRVEKEAGGNMDDDTRKWINYLSTHPMTEERLKAFE